MGLGKMLAVVDASFGVGPVELIDGVEIFYENQLRV